MIVTSVSVTLPVLVTVNVQRTGPPVATTTPGSVGLSVPWVSLEMLTPAVTPVYAERSDALTAGSGVPYAALTLIDTGGRQVGRGAAGEDGRYALSTPSAGSYVLIAAAGGHQPQAVSVAVSDRPVELDVVLGGAGADRIFGGRGNDRLAGGTDADRFIFDVNAYEHDVIEDFDSASDTIEWHGTHDLAITQTTGGVEIRALDGTSQTILLAGLNLAAFDQDSLIFA